MKGSCSEFTVAGTRHGNVRATSLARIRGVKSISFRCERVTGPKRNTSRYLNGTSINENNAWSADSPHSPDSSLSKSG